MSLVEAAPWAAVVALALFNPRVVGWLRARAQGGERREECEVCGARPRRISVVTAMFDDDDALGIDGGSAMTATYCRRHAPSVARRRRNPLNTP